MLQTIQLECACKQVKANITGVSKTNGNLVVCCCADCQAFANHLNNELQVLDEYGGTQIYQCAQSQLEFTQGKDKVTCLRLKPKGLTRWYTSCCETPIGNTVNNKMAFVGIIHSFFAKSENIHDKLGPNRAYVQVQDAIGSPNYPFSSKKFGLKVTLKILFKIIRWKLKGMHQPSPFYDADGKRRRNAHIINNT